MKPPHPSPPQPPPERDPVPKTSSHRTWGFRNCRVGRGHAVPQTDSRIADSEFVKQKRCHNCNSGSLTIGQVATRILNKAGWKSCVFSLLLKPSYSSRDHNRCLDAPNSCWGVLSHPLTRGCLLHSFFFSPLHAQTASVAGVWCVPQHTLPLAGPAPQ